MNQFPYNYFVLNRKVLKAIFENSKNQLNKAEWKQILYWQPKTVGEIIFNFLD